MHRLNSGAGHRRSPGTWPRSRTASPRSTSTPRSRPRKRYASRPASPARQYADGIGLSATADGLTPLTARDIDRFDWLPGTVADVYALAAVYEGGLGSARSPIV